MSAKVLQKLLVIYFSFFVFYSFGMDSKQVILKIRKNLALYNLERKELRKFLAKKPNQKAQSELCNKYDRKLVSIFKKSTCRDELAKQCVECGVITRLKERNFRTIVLAIQKYAK